MQRSMLWTIVLVWLIASQSPSGLGATDLSVKKVVLYKNGMGYFQHLGNVTGAEEIEIRLRSSQLDDVLKSLTVLDLSGGRIAEITYDSSAPLSRRLGELPVDLSSTTGILAFLEKLKGVDVEVSGPEGTVSGRLLSADLRRHDPDSGRPADKIEIGLFTTNGELRLVELQSLGRLRISDPKLSTDIMRALQLLGSGKQRDLRNLRIKTEGTGGRQLFVAYTSESPIWKTTYRVVFDEKNPPLLQGWAIVDNTTPVDWDNVELSLVAGAPVSFIQKLSEPLYGRRAVIPVQVGPQVSPEIHEGALQRDEDSPAQGPVGTGDGKYTLAKQAARSSMEMMSMAAAEPRLADEMRRSTEVQAEAQTLGDQFEYRIRGRVTIGRNRSALLPIVQTEVEANKISVFNQNGGAKRPRLAIWLKNTSDMTLDGGAFTVLDSNAFAGEGLLETLQPGERRILSYAIDSALEIESRTGSERKRVERVTINRGVLRLVRKLVEKRTYRIRNNAERERQVVIEHPIRAQWKLLQPRRAKEQSAHLYRFQTTVPSQTSQSLVVEEERPEEAVYRISQLTSRQIELWIRDSTLDSETERALKPIVDKRSEIDRLQKRVAELKQDESDIFNDQKRVRENLNRLGRTTEESRLRERYVGQMEEQENLLQQLRSERNRLEDQLNNLQRELSELIQGLSLDRQL